ncbi:MAG: glucosaminidase domain-containing protein [Sphingobacteriales bacterium]|nr:glucosaminidase domain-containing protein [Sphingobacteriales bacterium]
MKNLKVIGVAAVLFLSNAIKAQYISIEEYVNTYKEMAMEEMKRTGVPAAITLAQGILETENGNSVLVKKSNNHFGIKCKEDWKGPSVSHTDDAPWECFRKYESAEESYRDHSNFLKTRKYYASLFEIDPTDYKAWAYGLKKAGYATNPQYAQQLIKYIETYNLQQYSLIAMGKMQKQEEVFSKTEQTKTPQPIITEQKKETVAVKEPEQKEAIKVIQSAPAVTLQQEKPIVLPKKEDIIARKEEVVNKPVIETPAVVKEEKLIYPQGVFKINETRVLFAAKGTSLLAIAEQNSIPLNYLMDFNELKNSNILENDQLIYLQRKRRQGTAPTHTVKADESLYDIAQNEGIRLEALLQYNLLSNPSLQVQVGESLNLQGMADRMPQLKSPAMTISANNVSSSKGQKTHVVEAKETIYSISRKYNVPVNQLMDWNKMKGYDVKIGQELIIAK